MSSSSFGARALLITIASCVDLLPASRPERILHGLLLGLAYGSLKPNTVWMAARRS